MAESPEARRLRAEIEEQNRIDAARVAEVNAARRAELDRKQNERDRQAETKRLKEAAGEE